MPFKKLSAAMHMHGLYSSKGTISGNSNKTLAIMQLNHPGRQSSNFIGGWHLQSTLTVSSKRCTTSTGVHAERYTCSYIPDSETNVPCKYPQMIQIFVEGAKVAHLSGFDGIQLHVAHGCELYHLFSYTTRRFMDGRRSFGALMKTNHNTLTFHHDCSQILERINILSTKT